MTNKQTTAVPVTSCIHGDKSAPCISACPFNLDVRELVKKIGAGSFIAAYGLYRDAVIFPGLAWRLCPSPCAGACGGVLGEKAVNIPLLERSLFEMNRTREPVNYNSPRQNKSVVILGASLRGMTAALKLAQGGFEVTVLESGDRICPELDALLDRADFEDAILSQFKFAKCDLRLGVPAEVSSLDGFDAVLVANGAALPETEKLFVLEPQTPAVNDIPAGKLAAREAEWYLKTGNRKKFEESQPKPVAEDPQSGARISGEPLGKAECRQQAAQCTGCDCSACLEQCTLLRDYGYDVVDLSRAVGLALNIFEHTETREGLRQIGSCNFCGLCKNLCPVGVDVGEFLLNARTELYAQGVLPEAHHEFWLRDHDFANSEQAALFYMPQKTSQYLFFPGCQAGGSDARYVSMTYEKLLRQYPDTAILLHCCGAPVLWAGDKKGMEAEHAVIRDYWRKAGEPTLVTICPSCYRMFKDHMPEIPVRMVYDILAPEACRQLPFEQAAVFDPCASRDYPEMQQAVRVFAAQSGVRLEELRYHGKLSQCCSWGGHGYNVNRKVTDRQAKEQVEMSDLPYITYCTNCHDIFAARGKECRHILDLIHGINLQGRKPPTLRQRRVNRYALKKELIERYGIDAQMPELETVLDLRMEPEMLVKLDRELIMLEDISAVIRTSERTKLYILHADINRRSAHLRRGIITYWVEYEPNGDGSYTVFNAYSHRMHLLDDIMDQQAAE